MQKRNTTIHQRYVFVYLNIATMFETKKRQKNPICNL